MQILNEQNITFTIIAASQMNDEEDKTTIKQLIEERKTLIVLNQHIRRLNSLVIKYIKIT